MAKLNKDFELRMQGMIAAQNIVKKDGIDALEKEIKFRGLTRTPLNISTKETEDFIHEISENLFVTIKTISLMALKDEFGFGATRMERFEKKFQKLTEDTTDMNWIGNHFVSMTDYAKYLQDEYDIHIDTEVVERVQRVNDSRADNYKIANVDRLVADLSENGYEDAATYVLKRWAER